MSQKVYVPVSADLRKAIEDVFGYRWMPGPNEGLWCAFLLGLQDLCAFYGVAHDDIVDSTEFLSKIDFREKLETVTDEVTGQEAELVPFMLSNTAYNTLLIDFWIGANALGPKCTMSGVAGRIMEVGISILFHALLQESRSNYGAPFTLPEVEYPYQLPNIQHWSDMYYLLKPKLQKEFAKTLEI